MTTGSGEITAQGVPSGDWKLRTGSGGVTVEFPADAAFELYAQTSSGNIETKHAIAVEGKISTTSFTGKSAAAGRASRIQDEFGDDPDFVNF